MTLQAIQQIEAIDALLGARGQAVDDAASRYNLIVGRVAALLARTIGLPLELASTLGLAARLHDVGLTTLPPMIAHPTRARNAAEEKLYRQHPVQGARLLSLYSDPIFAMAADICRYAHEKIDGSGWPEGVHGRFIPQEARIVSVALAYVDLRLGRTYADKMSHGRAVEILTCGDERHRPEQYDDRILFALEEAGDRLASIVPADSDL